MEKQVEAIWYEFSAVLRRFILKRVGDEQAADDILQEVFVKVHRHLESLNDETRLESWLYQIARNAIAEGRGNLGDPVGSGRVFFLEAATQSIAGCRKRQAAKTAQAAS